MEKKPDGRSCILNQKQEEQAQEKYYHDQHVYAESIMNEMRTEDGEDEGESSMNRNENINFSCLSFSCF